MRERTLKEEIRQHKKPLEGDFELVVDKDLTKEQYEQHTKELLHRVKILKEQRNEVIQKKDELITLIEGLIEDYDSGRTLEYSIEALKRTLESMEGDVKEWQFYHG